MIISRRRRAREQPIILSWLISGGRRLWSDYKVLKKAFHIVRGHDERVSAWAASVQLKESATEHGPLIFPHIQSCRKTIVVGRNAEKLYVDPTPFICERSLLIQSLARFFLLLSRDNDASQLSLHMHGRRSLDEDTLRSRHLYTRPDLLRNQNMSGQAEIRLDMIIVRPLPGRLYPYRDKLYTVA